jgi:hypothetical protein
LTLWTFSVLPQVAGTANKDADKANVVGANDFTLQTVFLTASYGILLESDI